MGGSFAQTGFPAAVTSATYDAANELTNWNGTALSYDLNGNMLSDGTNTFSWNARNQVATLNNVSLQYDGFGRRTKNLQNTSFLFDGANAVQELSGSTPTANLISGGIDEIFTRADSSGAYTPLQDALGSTIALVDANGNLVTQYAYDPFGNTSISGATNSNAFQYTGRENEGNGLYFYRARYYSPRLGRFINQDPMGFAGSGPNLYAYAFNSPTNFMDPTGMSVAVGDVVVVLRGVGYTQAQIDEAIAYLGTGSGGGAVGWGAAAAPLVAAYAATGATVYASVLASSAEINANAAYDEEWQSVIKYNQAIMAHPRPLPLAGRYTGGHKPNGGNGGNDDDGCKKEWKDAADYCSQLDDIPRDSPRWTRELKQVFGGNMMRCMRGQVSQRCGGSKVDW